MSTHLRTAIATAALSATLFTANAQTPSATGTWWHWMNGHITREGITKDLEAMKANGIDNATILNVYRPFGSQFKAFEKYVAPENMRDIDESAWPVAKFASPEWYDLFRWALDEAERLGMTIGTANCDGWSETGGPWIAPENSMKGITYAKVLITGASELQSLADGRMEIELPQPETKANYYEDVCVLAYPVGLKRAVTLADVKDLTPYLDAKRGVLTVPAELQFSILSSEVKRFEVLRFGYTTTGQKTHPASPEGAGFECDKMDTTALNLHFAHYNRDVMKAAGRHCGKTFSYFLVDSWECRLQTWTKHLPEEFARRRGYSMLPYLPVLAGDAIFDATTCDAFIHDYRLTLGELIEEYFFKHLADLCHANGMLLYSEGIYGGKDDIPGCDIMATYKYCDVPMTEFWARLQAMQNPITSKVTAPFNHILPQHAALLYDKPILASEAYTGAAIYSESPWDLVPYANQAYSEGVSKMMLHSYVHQMQDRGPGFTLGIYGQAFNRLNPWFNESLPYWTWQQRIQEQMQGAQRCADALIYIGDCRPANECKADELARLIPEGQKYQYINAEALAETQVRDGRLVIQRPHLKGIDYQYIIVRQSAINLLTMRQLHALHKAGAKVCGVKPVASLGLLNHAEESAEVLRLANEIWGDNDFLPAPEVKREVVFADKADDSRINYLHRKRAGKDAYFLANMQDDKELMADVTFTREVGRSAVLLDPMDGRRYAMTPRDGAYRIKLRPRQAVIVLFGEEVAADASYDREVLAPAIVETLHITKADGRLSFPSDKDIKTQKISELRDITESKNPDIKYYCGVLEYDLTLTLPEKYIGQRLKLNLPALGATAHVWVGNSDLGTVWDPTYALDITDAVATCIGQSKKGQCTFPVKLRLTNPWRNRLVGDLNQNRGDKAALCTSPGIEKYGDIPFVRRDQVLIPAGLSQGINLIVMEK